MARNPCRRDEGQGFRWSSSELVAQSSVKLPKEISEIEKGLRITYDMYTDAAQMVRPGAYELEIFGKGAGIALAAGGNLAFPPIVTITARFPQPVFRK